MSLSISKKTKETATVSILFKIVVLVAFVYLLIFVFTGYTPIQFSKCDSHKRDAFLEFPHYNDIHVEPETEGETGSCRGFLSTDDSAEQIVAYYQDQLVTHEWFLNEVKEYGYSTDFFDETTQQWGTIPATTYRIVGIRDSFFYVVEIDDSPTYTIYQDGSVEERHLSTKVSIWTRERESE